MRGRKLAVLAVAGSVMITWWMLGRQSPPEPAATPAPSVAVSTTAATPATITIPASQVTPSEPSVPQSPPGDEGLSSKEKQRVGAFAVRFMKAFAKPTAAMPTRRWWERVAGMLSDDAVDTYQGITPAQVPFTKVTGGAQLEPVDDSSDAFWIQPVTVPTNAGRWTVLIQLPAAGYSKDLKVLEVQEP